jgi:hypothetical protein
LFVHKDCESELAALEGAESQKRRKRILRIHDNHDRGKHREYINPWCEYCKVIQDMDERGKNLKDDDYYRTHIPRGFR